jgi:hypothetical protein
MIPGILLIGLKGRDLQPLKCRGLALLDPHPTSYANNFGSDCMPVFHMHMAGWQPLGA